MLLAPSAVILGVFVIYPLGRSVWLGHQRCDVQGKNCVSNGWDQYIDVIRSNEFRDAVVVTAKFALTEMTLDPKLEPEWQLPKGPGRKVTIIDEATRFGTPDEVAARSWPTLPLIPQWAPAGYRLTDVASAGFTPTGSTTQDWTADDVRKRSSAVTAR